MYVNDMRFRGIERVKKVHQITGHYMGKASGSFSPTCLCAWYCRRNRWTRWVGNFRRLKKTGFVATWHCYFYVTDGWSVDPGFIPEGDQIVSKTYMTRVEGENTRLRHYLARLHRQTLCYSKSVEMLKHKGSIVTSLSQSRGFYSSTMIHTLIQQRRFCNAK